MRVKKRKLKWERLLKFRCPYCKRKLERGKFYFCPRCNFKIEDVRLAEIREDLKYRKERRWWK